MIYLVIIGVLLYLGVCFEVINQIGRNYSGGQFAIWLIAFVWPILLFLFLGSLIANLVIKIGSKLRGFE